MGTGAWVWWLIYTATVAVILFYPVYALVTRH